jgi:hypothetical protein
MSQGFEPINPYHSPQAFPGQYPFAPAPAAEESLPTYCKVMFIIDLVMSGLRLLVVPLSVLGYAVIKDENPEMLPSVIAEIVTGAGIGICGVLAAIVLLMRKPWGLAPAGAAVFFTLGALLVGVWQVVMQWDTLPIDGGGPERVGFVIGVFLSLAVRGGLLIA